MERMCVGYPNCWAAIGDSIFIVTSFEYDAQVNSAGAKTGAGSGISTFGVSISGQGRFFGKREPDVFQKSGKPRMVTMHIRQGDTHIAFENTAFSLKNDFDFYECEAFELEWIAERMKEEENI